MLRAFAPSTRGVDRPRAAREDGRLMPTYRFSAAEAALTRGNNVSRVVAEEVVEDVRAIEGTTLL